MTPDERALLTTFLDDLAQARAGAKDPEADAMIRQAFAANPDAAYLMVQHTILSDQALHAAQARIAELEARQAPAPSSSFLGGGSIWGSRPAATAVPPTAPSAFAPGGGLGSFLRNVGTTAAGVAGGEMLFEGLSGLFGGHRGFGWGGGFGGMGGGYGGPVENVVINNYEDGGSYDGGADWGGGSDNSGNDN
jgi:hypothetical protein